MNQKLTTDGIIFDLDGTLWDSSENITKSWNLALQELNMNRVLSLEEVQKGLGLPMDEIFRRLFPDEKEETQRIIGDKVMAVENEYLTIHGGNLYPNLESTLQALQERYPLTIVSNCQAGYIEAFMTAHHLTKYFCDYESFGNTGLLKADNIKLVVERNHFQHPIYVGDIQGDADASHKAGVPIVHAAYGFGDIVDAEGRVDSFCELLEILA